jgi:hypothetical protein
MNLDVHDPLSQGEQDCACRPPAIHLMLERGVQLQLGHQAATIAA